MSPFIYRKQTVTYRHKLSKYPSVQYTLGVINLDSDVTVC